MAAPPICRTLTATVRPSRVSSARYTAPMPPRPTRLSIRYGPSCVPFLSSARGDCPQRVPRRRGRSVRSNAGHARANSQHHKGAQNRCRMLAGGNPERYSGGRSSAEWYSASIRRQRFASIDRSPAFSLPDKPGRVRIIAFTPCIESAFSGPTMLGLSAPIHTRQTGSLLGSIPGYCR